MNTCADDVIHLVYALDENYVFPVLVSAASAVRITKTKIVIHIFDMGLSDSQFDDMASRIKNVNENTEVVRHTIDKEIFKGFPEWHGSIAPCARMVACEILKDVDWTIYCDGDTIWTKDVKDLWDLREDKYLIMGSVDNRPEGDKEWYSANNISIKLYFCSGLILMNLKKMREQHIDRKCIEFISKHPDVPLPDQTTLNAVCSEADSLLPPEWGVFSTMGELNNLNRPEGLIHFCQDLPWKRVRKISMITDVVNCWWYVALKILKVKWPPCAKMTRVEWIWRRFCFKVFSVFPCLLYIPFVKKSFNDILGGKVVRVNAKEIYRKQ